MTINKRGIFAPVKEISEFLRPPLHLDARNRTSNRSLSLGFKCREQKGSRRLGIEGSQKFLVLKISYTKTILILILIKKKKKEHAATRTPSRKDNEILHITHTEGFGMDRRRF